jgi:integrase
MRDTVRSGRSMFIGARTEELRALTWSHVDLEGKPATAFAPAAPPSITVWRSVRAGGDTKTKRSRRTLALPQRCVDVLADHRVSQERLRRRAGARWQDNDLVFPSRVGTLSDASHVRREFRKVVQAAGLEPGSGPLASFATALSRAFRRRYAGRAFRPPGRPQRDHYDRDRLPQADSARAR